MAKNGEKKGLSCSGMIGASIRSNFTFGFNVNENDTYSIVHCVFDDSVILDRR
ncbi:MAG: hypothetical protein IK990_03130 [Ruminiclostridium sp.]|nr:hypothetical protein [Ruminiclostridium sp.]